VHSHFINTRIVNIDYQLDSDLKSVDWADLNWRTQPATMLSPMQQQWLEQSQLNSLWPPYRMGQAIIFSCCGFHLLLSFFSSPHLSGRRLDVYHTSTHGVALVRI